MKQEIDRLTLARASGGAIDEDRLTHYWALFQQANTRYNLTQRMLRARDSMANAKSSPRGDAPCREDLWVIQREDPRAYATCNWPQPIPPVPPELSEAFRVALRQCNFTITMGRPELDNPLSF